MLGGGKIYWGFVRLRFGGRGDFGFDGGFCHGDGEDDRSTVVGLKMKRRWPQIFVGGFSTLHVSRIIV